MTPGGATSLFLLGLATLAGRPAWAGEAVAHPHARAAYDALEDILFGTNEGDRWFAVVDALKSGFERICGDTFCEGEYSNFSAIHLSCSSTTGAPRTVKECAWIFGASLEYVDGLTGEIASDVRVFACRIPVAVGAKQLIATLAAAGEHALDASLPGTGKSFYDGLVGCFDDIVAAPSPDQPGEPRFVELGEWLWQTDQDRALAWFEVTRRVAEQFDEVCGDAFCSGHDFAITPLGLACSLDRATEHVSHCLWNFAGASTKVDADGRVVADMATHACRIAIDAQASALVTALRGVEDPLFEATLPGKATTIYDALLDCFDSW